MASTQAAIRARHRRQRSAWVVVAVVWIGYFAVSATGAQTAQDVVKGLLMPALLLWVVAAFGRQSPRWLVAGLMFATVGDIGIDITFELGIAGFLVMQVCYIAGFLAMGARAGLRGRWALALPYLVVWLAANLGLGSQFGDLRIPVLAYSAVLCTMASLAIGLGPRIAVGAGLFLVSDLFIAFGQADIDFALRAATIMPTYLAGQYLIVTGWGRRVDPDVLVPA